MIMVGKSRSCTRELIPSKVHDDGHVFEVTSPNVGNPVRQLLVLSVVQI